MKIIFTLCILIMVKFSVYAEPLKKPSICNYMQIDGFLYDYQKIYADNATNSGETYQIFTGRPAIGFCFQVDDIYFRPNIALNPYNSSTDGSLLIGKGFFNKLEMGLFSSINSSQKTLGEGKNLNETLESSFLIGPYLYIYPNFDEQNLYEIFLKIAYEYDIIQNTANNSTALMTKKAGINIETKFLFGKKMSEHLTFTPNVVFIYSYTIDTVGGNLARNILETQIFPLSVRWEF